LEENESMSSENPSASQSLPFAGCLFTQTTREESDQSSRVERRHMSQTQTGSKKDFLVPRILMNLVLQNVHYKKLVLSLVLSDCFVIMTYLP
jgi:hypothetical protein